MRDALSSALLRLADLPVPQPASDGATEQAKQILAGDEFRPERKSLFERILEWIGDRLGDIFGNGGPSSGGASSVFSIVVGVVAIGLLLFVLTKIRVGKRVKADDEDDGAELLINEVRTRREWLDDALRHEAAGDWRLAMRARYRWLVARLADAGALQNIPGRTAGELRTHFAAEHPDEAALFAAATDLFELAWYANAPTGLDENDRFQSYANRLLQVTGADR